MLMMNQTRVLAVYVFAPSWNHCVPESLDTQYLSSSSKRPTRRPTRRRTRGNRIDELHRHIAETSTALVKYLPPVIPPKYDAFGKRVSHTSMAASSTISTSFGPEILYCISSVCHKTLCASDDFVRGFYTSVSMLRECRGVGAGSTHAAATMILVDTIAHNYRIIDNAVLNSAPVIWKNKWYYILYNAIIHEETLCKDILIM